MTSFLISKPDPHMAQVLPSSCSLQRRQKCLWQFPDISIFLAFVLTQHSELPRISSPFLWSMCISVPTTSSQWIRKSYLSKALFYSGSLVGSGDGSPMLSHTLVSLQDHWDRKTQVLSLFIGYLVASHTPALTSFPPGSPCCSTYFPLERKHYSWTCI